jgi:aryl-alcohol dehydrogenase-like predicted oxidoreductase
MLWRGPEAELFALTKKNGISHVVWSPLAQGVLTGKYKPGEQPPADSRAAHEEMSFAMGSFIKDDVVDAVQNLKPIADELGISMAQLALAWDLRRDEVASVIVGASRPEQVHDNVAASGITLSADVLERIDETLGDNVVRDFRFGFGMSEGVKHR